MSESEFAKAVKSIPYPITYGVITIQVRDGKATFVKIEKTVKLD